jgi:hypothetical protein
MSSGPGRKTSNTRRPSRLEQVARRAERTQALVVGVQVEERAERARDEPDALRHRRVEQVADAEVEKVRDACGCGGLRADLEHALRRVDPDHAHAGSRRRHRDPPGAHAELDDRAACSQREVDVEANVLGDAHRPRVVEARDGVVQAHGLRATKTYSRLSSVSGSRANPP